MAYQGGMALPPIHGDREWPYVLTLLPADLEERALVMRALVRRREIPSAASLLRLALAYAVSDLSLKDVAAWARAMAVARITGPGLFYRLREAEGWLAELLAQVLDEGIGERRRGLALRIVDATVINGPGAKGTEWRAHVQIDAASGRLRAVELTDMHGGERLDRQRFVGGEVVLGDRAYGTARGIAWVRNAEADVVVRFNPQTLRLCDGERQRIDLQKKVEEIPALGAHEWQILLPIPPEKRSRSHKTWPLAKAQDWIPVRVVAARARTGQIIWVLTTATAERLNSAEVLELYRLRWQIELLFKRLKSLLHLDQLPSRQGPTARSWMLARFLAAALAQKLLDPEGSLSPWGYAIGAVR
jgi:DDE family transposase